MMISTELSAGTEQPDSGTRYLVRLRIEADLILPKPSLDRHPRTLIAPGQTFVADEYLLNAVRRHVMLIREIPATAPAEKTGGLRDSPPASPICESGISSIDIPMEFFQAWFNNLGSRGARAGELLSLTERCTPALCRTLGENRHGQAIRLGELLRELADTTVGEWSIAAKRSGHSTRFMIRPAVAPPCGDKE